MDLNVGKELAALRRMPVHNLQSRYAEVFGETTNTHHKDWGVFLAGTGRPQITIHSSSPCDFSRSRVSPFEDAG